MQLLEAIQLYKNGIKPIIFNFLRDDKMDEKKDIKEYVEDKIFTYTFHAKNFSKEDMNIVDTYCKKHYGNDRKKMLLTLITLVENNVLVTILNDKINLLAETIANEIDNIHEIIKKDDDKPKKVKQAWKGFGDK